MEMLGLSLLKLKFKLLTFWYCLSDYEKFTCKPKVGQHNCQEKWTESTTSYLPASITPKDTIMQMFCIVGQR